MRLIIITILFVLPFYSFSQNQDTLQNVKKAAGVNAFFINTFLPLDNNIGGNAPYLFSFRKYKMDRKFTHQGLNLDFDGIFDNQEEEPEQNTNSIDIDYRIGWGKHWSIHPKVEMYGGCDLLLGVEYQNTKTVITNSGAFGNGTNKLNEWSGRTGVGPFVGVQFNITPRFGLYTEAAYYLNFSYFIETFKTDVEIQEDFTNKQFRYFRTFRLPGNLTLFYYFN